MARTTTEDLIAAWLCKRYGSASFKRDGAAAIEAWRTDARALMKEITRPILKQRDIDDGAPQRPDEPDEPVPKLTLGYLLALREKRNEET